MPKQKVKCSCGKEFERFVYAKDEYTPYDYMCPECNKNDWWRYATRMLGLEKFRCVKCTWKLTKEDSYQCDENVLWFHCKCCGLNFGLYFPDPDYYDY